MVISESAELRKWRKRVGLSQSQVAERSGFSQSLIARIERGDVDPRLSTFNKIKEVIRNASDDNTEKSTDLMSKPVIYAKPDEEISELSKKFTENQISQMPVIEDGKQLGGVRESNILDRISDNLKRKNLREAPVKEIMGNPFPILSANSDLSDILYLLKRNKAILITLQGEIEGIITRSDVIDLI